MERLQTFYRASDVSLTRDEIDGGLVIAAYDLDNVLNLLSRRRDWRLLRAKTILDLGCGSRLTPRAGRAYGWPPYFCLMAAAEGALAYGIDIYPASPEDDGQYNHIQADLVDYVLDKHLGEIPGISGLFFDAIHAHALTIGGNRVLDPILDARRVSLRQFRELLTFQARELLKPKGILLLDT